MQTEEVIDIINREDEVVGQAVISEIYKKKFPHRIVHVLLMDEDGKIACQIRSKHKSFCPGCYSTSVGGHVQFGETPEEAAKREMKEELGRKGNVSLLFSEWYCGAQKIQKKLFVYKSTIKPPFKINKLEVDKIEYLPTEKILLKKVSQVHPELRFVITKLASRKIYKKLIRDKIPEIIKASGAYPEIKVLNKADFRKELKKKIVEEAIELENSENKKELMNELADMIELLDEIILENRIDKSKLSKIKKQKKLLRGGFKNKIFLEGVYERD